jgi:tRNA pseudouridine38-40 synthase
VYNLLDLPGKILHSLTSKYFLRLSFSGTRYNGWQLQTNAKSVQGILNEKLSLVLREDIKLTGAGRTDSGVHAKCFYAHFDSALLDSKKVEKIIYQLNSVLPSDIAIQSIIEVNAMAHSRFSAISRTYEYYIHSKKDPFLEGISFYFHRSLDFDLMNLACKLLLEYDDFKCFSKNHTDVKTYICHIFNAEWKTDKNTAVFHICADRFLRNMVRAIVGTMLELGTGNITLNDFEQIVLSRNRSMAGQSVPPQGLFLTDIKYPENIFI